MTLEIFYQSVVASGTNIDIINELIHKAGGIIGQNLETFDFSEEEEEEVTELAALHHPTIIQQSVPPPHSPETVELVFSTDAFSSAVMENVLGDHFK